MEITELLINDHREVDELFRRVNLSDRADSIDALTKQIVHELSVHAALEEQFVYPFLRLRVGGGRTLADHAIEEHSEAKRLLADLEKLDAGSSDHAKALDQLIDSVRHHVEEEENELLPLLRDAVREDVRNVIGVIAAGAKAVVPTHPHPLVPGTATVQLVAGPWLGALDRIRDLVGA